MTTSEFSTEFDILYNNIMSDTAPGLNAYEKSVFLTKAQEELIKNYFNLKGNKYLEGFDGSAKRQSDFSGLITVTSVNETVGATNTFRHDHSSTFEIPDNLMIFIQESLEVNHGNSIRILQVTPLRYDEYIRMMLRPFHYPPRNQAWRVIGNSTFDGGNDPVLTRNAQVIYHPGETVVNNGYTVVYIRKPRPIILEDLVQYNLTIDGVSVVSECELAEEIHKEILQRAVELAKAAYANDFTATIEMGKRSE